MLTELVEVSAQSIRKGSYSIDYAWTEEIDAHEMLIRQVLKNFVTGHVKSNMVSWLVARILTPWQRCLLHLTSYPNFPRYTVILGALFKNHNHNNTTGHASSAPHLS